MECAVVAIPDEQWGERPKAFVTLKPGHNATAAEIIADNSAAALAFADAKAARETLKALHAQPGIVHACLFTPDVSGYAPEDLVAKKRSLPETIDALGLAREKLAALPSWTAAGIEPALRGLAEHLTWKPGDLFSSIRVAVTGSKVSPPLFETMEVLGRERVVERLTLATGRLEV